MHARVVLGVGKGVLFREVSSVQEVPHRERGSPVVFAKRTDPYVTFSGSSRHEMK